MGDPVSAIEVIQNMLAGDPKDLLVVIMVTWENLDAIRFPSLQHHP